MKLQARKKDFKCERVYSVGYCKLQYLLGYEQPFAYSAGVYGWDCDYYNINGVYISTGYRPIGEIVDYKIIKEYEERAQNIVMYYGSGYDLKKQKINELLYEFIIEITKE